VMADLSPAAQAVLDALCMDELNGPEQLMARAHAAAALRAVATDWEAEIKGQFNTEFIQGIVNCIMALKEIAAELEGQ
jgi:hypothetical protein